MIDRKRKIKDRTNLNDWVIGLVPPEQPKCCWMTDKGQCDIKTSVAVGNEQFCSPHAYARTLYLTAECWYAPLRRSYTKAKCSGPSRKSHSCDGIARWRRCNYGWTYCDSCASYYVPEIVHAKSRRS